MRQSDRTSAAAPKEIGKKKSLRFRLIDLFSGAGGMTFGFTEANGHHFEPVWANDLDRSSVSTYNANFGPHCLIGDISYLLANRKLAVPPCDVVIGGPPCQGFSLLNKKRNGDPRKQLWRPFMEVVQRSGASVWCASSKALRQLNPFRFSVVAT